MDEDTVELSTNGNDNNLVEPKIHIATTPNGDEESQHLNEKPNVLSDGKDTEVDPAKCDRLKLALYKGDYALAYGKAFFPLGPSSFESEGKSMANPITSEPDPSLLSPTKVKTLLSSTLSSLASNQISRDISICSWAFSECFGQIF
ncbi:hypothetical protein RHGRI_036234 [Rhododendron griersonianum]|uniref:Uncharacterized protein n=1 Tax=Rhododendron griersonianum TaxID=479676 RepID=A0AAV6HN20_9ERIC|nr:hypothetical protein RHGRI_036234 [Rhododendron griersonianum]